MSRSDLLEPGVSAPEPDASAAEGAGGEPATLPLSRGQRALWFLHSLAPSSGAYVIAAAARIVGSVDVDALDRALRRLVARHEALRATFVEEDGRPVQRVSEHMPVRLHRIDARDWSEAVLDEALGDEAFRPFDLERGPLVRLTLFERGADDDDRLVFAIHHLVSDLWSLAVLLRELGVFYDDAGPLEPLETSYADLVERQEERIAGSRGEELLELWKDELAGRPASLDLPTDRRRPPTRAQRGAAEPFRLDAEHWKRLRKVGRSCGANPFLTGLAALQALLHRLSGQDDVLVGTPTAGRRSGDVSDLVGYCVNPVAVRADASGDPTFEDFLERVRDAGKWAFRHQDLPFPLLVEHLEPGRDASRPPIFQVLFTLQRSRLGVGEGMGGFALGEPGARLELGSLEVESVRLEPRGAQLDLSVFAAEVGGELWGSLVYDRDLFERTTVRRMAGQLRRLLAQVAAEPGRRLSELSLLGPAERQQLLVEWSERERLGDAPAALAGAEEGAGKGADAEPERLDALVRAQAARTPDAVAIVAGPAGGARLTYGELARRTAALAERLRTAGVGPEVRVGVCVPRGPELLVSLLAVLEAGGAYVPLDASYPEERLAFMLEDSAAPVVLATAETRGNLPVERRDGAPTVIDPLASPAGEEARGAFPPAPAAPPPEGPDLLAYVIYTSGSTGRPKGVAISHGAACALLRWASRAFSGDELDGMLAGTSICFDLSVFELFLPLAAGGCVVLAEDALGAAAHVATGAVRLVNTVPSAMKELVASGGLPESVRTVNLAGEPLQRALVDDIYRSRPEVERVYNLYGPSEDTTYSTVARIDPGGTEEPSIGVPVAGGRARVLDARMHPVPLGVPGELCLAGAGVARGYLGRPARTAESFVPDPFAPGGRLYRTGDLVRWRRDGRLDFLGRIDHQVKIRGFRIELGEIESVLTGHPRVEEAAVVSRERAGEPTLVGYVVARPESDGDGEASDAPLAATLRAALEERLPAYMVPAALVELDALPLTPNGKVDRKALPEPEWTAGAGGRAPRTPTEEHLAGLFADVLGLSGTGDGAGAPPVGVDDDFFRLGGHSLLATRLVARIRESLGVDPGVSAVFEAPTVAGLARRIEATGKRAPEVAPIPRRPDPSEAPVSFAQERLWFLSQLDSGAATYNMPAAVRMEGRLELPALARALGELTARHEALRTELVEAPDDGPVQRIRPPEEVGPHAGVVDLSALPKARRHGTARELAAREAAHAVDLDRAPLMRTRVLRLAPEEHVFVLVLHHVISDGWSLGVFVRELAALYGAHAAGRPAELAPRPVQFGDFALWQRRSLTEEVMEELQDWWREELDGAPTVLELPTDRPRPSSPDPRGGVVRVPLPVDLGRRLEELAGRRRATLFMVLLAGFDALLARISGTRDLVLGTASAGRDRSDLEDSLGLFVDTVPLRVRLDDDPSLAALIDRARATALDAFAHKQLPFDRLVDEIVPERRPGVPPLVQVLLTLQNAPMEPLELPGLRLERIPIESGTAKFDLNVSFEPDGDGLLGVWSFDSALFDATTVRRMAGHFRGILEEMAEAPERRVGELGLLSAAERHQALVEWNDEPWPVAPEGGCLHHRIERWARQTPDAVAVVLEPEHLTYGGLHRRAEVLAAELRRRGVGPESRVGLCTERSLEQVVGAVGILRAGAAYVPLDPSYPTERLETIIAEAGLKTVAMHAAVVDRLEGLDVEALFIDELPDELSPSPAGAAVPDAPEPVVLPDHPMYAIFTSGSTGRPKGVVVSHRAAENRLRYAAERDPVGRGPGLLKASICFDLSVLELFSPLVAGTRLVLARPGGQGDMEYLLGLISRQRIAQASFLPSQLNALLEQADLDRAAPLTGIMTGGETVPPTLPERFSARLDLPLYNRYGPTETTLSVTSWQCEGERGDRSIPIGRRIGGAEIYVLGPGLRPVPVGVPGEICIGGVCVTRGYLGRPERTAEQFVPSPVAAEEGERLYRSGDLGRWRPDGVLEFLGRIDQQVKVRGFRIELGDIEAALVQHPGVLEAAVVDHEEPGTENRRLAAYVVPEPSAAEPPEPAEMASFLAEKLPAYMVPSAFERLDELPLSPSGKVDRRRLPEPTWEGEARREYVAPRTPTEERLAGLFAEVLEAERVGAEDDFFDLGGHSLLATRLASRIRTAFDVELPLRRLFESPTVAGVAEAVEALRGGAGAAPASVAGPAPEEDDAPPLEPVPGGPGAAPRPASFAQERLWFLSRLDPDSAAYNMPGAVRIDGRLNPAALASALEGVVARHETLRTTFEETTAGVVQHVRSPAPQALPVVDLSALPAGRRRAVGEDLARRVTGLPFDLERGPLLRVALVRLAGDEHLVAFCMHHIASDGWSVGVLVRELAELYRARVEGAEPDLPELAVQYGDFAVWQRDWLRGEALERRLAWWKDLLEGAPAALELPLDRPRPPVQTFRPGEVRMDLEAEPGRPAGPEVERLARRLDATPFMVLLAALATVLGRSSGQDDLVLGSPIAGRTRAELEGLIGCFVNSLALRIDLSGEPTFAEMVGRVKELSLGAFAHQDLPFERLVEEVAPARDLSSTPLFQVMFAFQNAPREQLALPGAELEPVALPVTASKFDLTIDLEQRDDRLAVRLEFNRDLFDPTTVRRLGGHLSALVAGAVDAPEAPVHRMPMLPAAERHLLLSEWSDGRELARQTAGSGAECLHRLVARQVERTPEAEALVTTAERLSYRELEGRAEAVAARLRAAGVGPETRVGVFTDRSAAMVTALLGILKAGGASVPLDPQYPAERVAFMLEDSGAAAVLAEGDLAERLALDDLPERPAVLTLDEVEATAPAGAAAWSGPPVDPAQLAYLIYTSGSTGRPKGVAISHAAASAMVRWAGELFPPEALDGVLAATSICFDLSVYELFVPLAHGGRVVLARDALELPALATGGEVRLVNTVPSVMRELVAATGLPESVHTVNLAGEPLKRALADEIHERLPGLSALYNLYGPSEDTTYSTVAAVPPGGGEPTIGRPIAGTWAYVLDPAGRPSPAGVPGELHLAGDGLARGYLGRPGRTAESFVPDPFGAAPGGRLYRTGDLVRWLRDGELEFLGRLDHQVKVRGFRIELGEIEAVLAAHSAVDEAVVTVRDVGESDTGGDLVAYLVPAERGETAAPLAGRAREWLQDRLPGYMIPSLFTELDELPRTPSGKIDRKSLPEPAALQDTGRRFEPPETELELLLAELWREVLGIEEIGIHDDFFELGGHSLKATQILLRVQDEVGVEIPVRRFFEDPTIGGLAVALGEALMADVDEDELAALLDDEET